MERYPYHIKVLKKDLSDYILLVGSPDRISVARQFLQPITYDFQFREFKILTGYYEEEYVSIISSGIGADNTEIVLNELRQITDNAVIVRAGTCGSIAQEARLKGFVISEGAVRFENTSLFYVPEGYPAFSDFKLFRAIVDACVMKKVPFCTGLTATFPGFYRPQGRNSRFYENTDIIKKLQQLGVKNIEMETSALFSIGRFLGFKCAAVCAVVADRINEKYLSPEEVEEIELKLVEVGLLSLKIYQKSS
ncbi:MAG: nucleoside phosphorylase [Planctomycetota bacterium]